MFEYDKDLTPLTTFGIPAKASIYAEYSSLKELLKISRTDEYVNNEILHIGGGSNLLFVTDFEGLVLHSAIKGIRKYEKNSDEVFVIAGAGEKWSDFVDWCVENDLGGVENMAGIPGEVGASPVQNVGAYGAEAKDVIFSVRCFDTLTREVKVFKNEECEFGYRDSRFKHEWKGRYIVLDVSFKLIPSSVATNLEYGALKSLAERLGYTPSIKEVAEEVKRIRDSKLPDPALIGSAGSFFKNPVVSKYFFEEQIQPFYPDIQSPHPVGKHFVKLSAAWLIDHSGLKGAKVGGAEVYPKQCLVIANSGNASAKDIVDLASNIVTTVREKFGVNLKPEVNYIDTSMEVTILGSGTSKGVPEVGCDCKVCRSSNPKDKRFRASALVRTRGMNILIDVSPDFRQQALSQQIHTLDAAIITHSHYDHVGGIDDLRPFCAEGDFPLYLKDDVLSDLKKRIDYCFRPSRYPGVPGFKTFEVSDLPFLVNGIKVIPIKVMHGNLPILGYRIGDFAYITDAKTIAEEELLKLEGVKVLVINALREREHFAHLSFSEALEIIERINPERAYLTHLNHEAGFHDDLVAKFGPRVLPAYDGLKFKV